MAVREQKWGTNKVYLLLGDHLGSTRVSYDVSAGTHVTECYIPPYYSYIFTSPWRSAQTIAWERLFTCSLLKILLK